jgi:uncharacterized protein (TIGR00255 family)
MKSMTGYGKVSFADGDIFYLLEIHAVNRKNLDISIFLPREMFALDIEIRKWIGGYVKRGQVTLKLSRDAREEGLEYYIPQLSTLQTFKTAWDELSERLGLGKGQVSLEFLIDQLDKIPRSQKKELELFTVKLEKAFKEAAEAFIKMKQEEGHLLSQEIVKHITLIKEALVVIQEQAKSVPEEYRRKLENRLQQLELFDEEAKERIAREAVLYADKSDITEEIERLLSHIKSFEEKMLLEEAVGKVLDFLIQEMHREANTIASKSQNLQITTPALLIKSEIEKIREQIQNIE